MLKTAIVFRSRYGASKEYAHMLGKRMAAEIVENEGLTPQLLSPFDCLVLIGGVYAGKISGIELFAKNKRAFEGKKLAVFAVGASPASEEIIQDLKKHNLRGESIPIFYGRGAFCDDSLSFVDRNLVSLIRRGAEKRKPEKRTELENVILEAGNSCNWIDEAFLGPVEEFLRTL